MYNFLLGCWIRRQVDEATLRSFVPRWITQEECDRILATKQNPEY